MSHPPNNLSELRPLLAPAFALDELGRLGDFPILAWCGAGGMGFVCKARQPGLARVIALKVMKPAFAGDITFLLRFQTEGRTMAAIRHSHVVLVHSPSAVTVRYESRDCVLPCLVMEYLEGETLHSRLEREKRLPVEEILRIGREIAEGLAAIHEQKLIHRDIKPGNLWLEVPQGRVKILDFGLARGLEDTHLTETHQRPGTGAYMAPEQLDGEELDGRCDLFSLGCVLYEASAGKRAFENRDRSVLPRSPHEVNSEVPPPLSDLIMKLLARDRTARYPSAHELLEELESLAGIRRKPDRPGSAVDSPSTVLELTFTAMTGSPWQGEAKVGCDGQVSPPFPVGEGLTAKERQEVRWYVEAFMDLPEGGNLVRAEAVEKRLRTYGEELWQQLRRPEVEAWLKAVQAAKSGWLVLRVEKPGDEVAFRSAWELLRVGEGGGTPLHQLGVSVVRHVKPALPTAKARDTSAGLRVLVVVCRPDGAGFLDPRYTPEAIPEALKDRPEVTVEFCRPPTLAALVRTLEQARDGEPYHVVHFDGHGTTAEGGVGALCFEDDKGELDTVRADRLGTLLAGLDVPLMVLAACRTSMKDSSEETVATALLRQGVGTVLAMGYAVHVDMDRELIAGFYEAIARGKSLGAAVQWARKRLLANMSRRLGTGPDAPEVKLQDWFVPQLYQAGDDPVLLPQKPRGRKKQQEGELTGFPPAPRAGFQGRGRELHRLERALLAHRVVVMYAPGGSGKTALAREAAYWWTRTGLFPDGAVFASFERTQSPEAVLTEVGQALEGEKFLQRKDPRKGLVGLLKKRRLLVIWDNYESVLPAFRGGEATPPEFAELAREWTAGGSRLLVTSRDGEVGLEGAWPFALGELSLPEGLLLLVRYLERLGADRQERVQRGLTVEALGALVERLGGHPLALELMTPFVRGRGVAAVLEELGPLLAQAAQTHGEGRNRSLWASLHFSIRHLSEATRAALPAVALLAGGCLENMAPMVTGLEAAAWATVRAELERTGLVRVEGPVLRPHPVLADVPELAPTPEVQERFLAVVGAFCGEFDELVRSPEARAALTALSICKAVVLRAVERALADGNLQVAWALADSLKLYLERRGRSGEGARLMTRLHKHLGAEGGELTEVAANLERQAAVARAAHDADGAQQALEGLLVRLRVVQSWDCRFQQAVTLRELGSLHYDLRRQPADALAPLAEAGKLFHALETEGRNNSTNRAAVLGDRANALRALTRLDEALAAAEESLALNRARKDGSAVARCQGVIAGILAAQGRTGEAEERYGEALVAARAAGDDELQGIIAQHLGVLALNRSHPDEAVAHLREALAAFQRAHDEHNQMRVLNSLGNVESQRGNLEAALAWYDGSLERARKLDSGEGQATARSGRALIFSTQAQQATDPDRARQLLERAITEERAALILKKQLGQPNSIRISHNNLADNLRLAGALDEAEEHARKALAICEQWRAPTTWKTLWLLEEIAAARGDAAAAAEWRQRKEAARIEAEARAGTPSLPLEMVAPLLQLAAQARAESLSLEEALTGAGAKDDFLPTLAARYSWLVAHLRALAAGAAHPADAVPGPYRDLLDAAWQQAVSG